MSLYALVSGIPEESSPLLYVVTVGTCDCLQQAEDGVAYNGRPHFVRSSYDYPAQPQQCLVSRLELDD